MSVLEYRSGTEISSDFLRRITNHWLAWAVYLGMSWTWCIGMFLPVLLIRDYAVWGWVIFAVPNVVGAALMGWVLREGKSEQLVSAHRRAIDTFSFITATFQLFFGFWMFGELRIPVTGLSAIPMGVGMVGAAVIFLLGITFYRPLALYFCLGALMVSWVCMARYASRQSLDLAFYGTRFYPELLALLPVCIFGFGLCPYLDATFHLTRQVLPKREAHYAFSSGFGLFFLSMIVFTLMYSRDFIRKEFFYDRWRMIVLHMAIQLALTAALHWHVRTMPWIRCIVTVVVAILLWWIFHFVHLPYVEQFEFGYRIFMSFYGLVFPAYVYLCMLPTWWNPSPPSRRMILVCVIAILLAAPFYWLGFIDNKMLWLLPGLAIILLARFFVRRPVLNAASAAGPIL